MPTSKSRQRQLARDKYQRQMVRKAQAERRRRQLQAGFAGVAVVLVTLGLFWIGGAFDSPPTPQATDICLWTPRPNADTAGKEVGTPSTTDVPTSGTRKMSLTLTGGLVEADLDLAAAPCTGANFAYLASKTFFDNTKCTALTGTYLLCGDVSGSGNGNPPYSYVDENTPADAIPPAPTPSATTSPGPTTSPGATPSAAPSPPAPKAFYPKGTVATYNTGPGTNGSQFLIFFQDGYLDARYSKFGTVTKGLDVIEEIAKVGAVDAAGKVTAEGKPKNDVVLQSLTVGEVLGPTSAPTPGPLLPSATEPETAPTAASPSTTATPAGNS